MATLVPFPLGDLSITGVWSIASKTKACVILDENKPTLTVP